MPLKDLRTPRQVAVQRIGHWPGLYSTQAARVARNNSGLRTAQSSSSAHAVAVWNSVRESVARRAPVLEKGAGGGSAGRARLPGLCDLEFIGVLSAHVSGCRRCGTRGSGADTPEQWLMWAVGRRRTLREVLEPVLTAAAAAALDGAVSDGKIAAAPPGLAEWARSQEAGRARRRAVAAAAGLGAGREG